MKIIGLAGSNLLRHCWLCDDGAGGAPAVQVAIVDSVGFTITEGKPVDEETFACATTMRNDDLNRGRCKRVLLNCTQSWRQRLTSRHRR